MPSNDNMGGDPTPGVVKSFSVLFRQYSFGSSSETSHARALYASEGGQISLDTTYPFDPAQSDTDTRARLSAQATVLGDLLLTIDEAVYGGKDVKALINEAHSRYQAGGGKLPWSFRADNVSMGGDPLPGQVKSAKVVFRTYSVNRGVVVGEGGALNFS